MHMLPDGVMQRHMCMWQVLVGVFWPSMMKLRSQYVPEDLRATILNLFRIPLNLFVCLVLYNVGTIDLSASFPVLPYSFMLASLLPGVIPVIPLLLTRNSH